MAQTSTEHESETPPRTPGWVKAFGLILIVLVLALIVLHLTGDGFASLHGYAQPAEYGRYRSWS